MSNDLNEAQGQPASAKSKKAYSLSPLFYCYTKLFYSFVLFYKWCTEPDSPDRMLILQFIIPGIRDKLKPEIINLRLSIFSPTRGESRTLRTQSASREIRELFFIPLFSFLNLVDRADSGVESNAPLFIAVIIIFIFMCSL